RIKRQGCYFRFHQSTEHSRPWIAMASNFLAGEQPRLSSLWTHIRWLACWSFAICILCAPAGAATSEFRKVVIRDITTIQGVRDNALIGYGVVVGLKRTGDSQQTQFTTQTLANVLQRLGVQVSPASVQVRNVAAVMVTGTLPPFARTGTTVDVTVSSIG